jgi:hypothetical protein
MTARVEKRISFPRHENGLIDFDCYLPYLPDEPSETPVMSVANGVDWVYQHVYFTETAWRQFDRLPEERDAQRALFHLSTYNQIQMRPLEELRVHQDHEQEVEPLSCPVIEQSLADFGELDIIAATTLGIQVAKGSQIWGEGVKPSDHKILSPWDAADILEDIRALSLNKIMTSGITPQRVITSALKRAATLLNDRDLSFIADERLEEDSVYYPLRIPRLGRLSTISNQMLKRHCEAEILDAIEKPEDVLAA